MQLDMSNPPNKRKKVRHIESYLSGEMALKLGIYSSASIQCSVCCVESGTKTGCKTP